MSRPGGPRVTQCSFPLVAGSYLAGSASPARHILATFAPQEFLGTIFAKTQLRPLMNLVMETQNRDYRLERWIAIILALLFLLPFVAQAEERPLAIMRSGDAAPVKLAIDGTETTMAWRCKSTGIDGFDQCALLCDGKVVTWRMAPEGQELTALVRVDGEIRISRGNARVQPVLRLASHSSRRMP